MKRSGHLALLATDARQMFARLALFLVAAVAIAVPGSAHAATIGIADQKPDMFADARFRDIGVRHARVLVPWDALGIPWQAKELDDWFRAAQAAGVSPLVSFGRSRIDPDKAPSPARMRTEFRRFRALYPWVRDFGTWNEANHCGEPTCRRPGLVAAYYRALRRECRKCRILAAEVIEVPNMERWVRAFKRAARQEPRYWGLHNYIDANRLRTTGTRRLLRVTKGQIWFTETGGVVKRTNPHKVRFPESISHAAKAMRFLFRRLVPLSRRVTRVYVYSWNHRPDATTWDSALIGPTGQPRPAYRVLVRELSRARAARRRSARR